jgi:response regulator RpfG family c-di-GMP phosphodiesterase
VKTILLLEDDPSNLLALSALLSSAGYRVLEATTGKEAIEVGDSHDGVLDLLVSDVDVPEPSGTAVALQLIKSRPGMRVLFVSGTPMDDWSKHDRDHFRQLSADVVDFMEKPFWLAAFLGEGYEALAREAASKSDLTTLRQ